MGYFSDVTIGCKVKASRKRPTKTITDSQEAYDTLAGMDYGWPVRMSGPGGSFRVEKRWSTRTSMDVFLLHDFATELTGHHGLTDAWKTIFGARPESK